MKKRKRRSIVASRAASLKGWRTKHRMQLARIEFGEPGYAEQRRRERPTIDLIPKVRWP